MKESLRSYGESAQRLPAAGLRFSDSGCSGVRPPRLHAWCASRAFSGVGVCSHKESLYTAIISLCLRSKP